MNSQKCLGCGLVNQPTADSCISCGVSLVHSLDNNSLFNCPDCGNQCSGSANSCPSCGRVFNSIPIYEKPITQPKKNSSLFKTVMIIIVLAYGGLWTLRNLEKALFSPPVSVTMNTNTNSTQPVKTVITSMTSSGKSSDEADRQILLNAQNPESRKRYAFGLESAINRSKTAIKNTKVLTQGAEDEILVITSDGIGEQDCSSFAMGDYGNVAAAIGFKKVICRNRASGSEWDVNIFAPPF